MYCLLGVASVASLCVLSFSCGVRSEPLCVVFLGRGVRSEPLCFVFLGRGVISGA